MEEHEIIKFVESQKSLHLYKNIQNAFIDVLSKLNEAEFKKAKKTAL